MAYKVFFVEDEVVTREGIRDNVDWSANGFEFCGEASDGEIALPILQSARPDVLITDIKMPFMDGLQLSKIVLERMPGVKIIILSGHDEFNYAQKAIELGVTEYLLKPVTVQDIHNSLQKVAAQLDLERAKQKDVDLLQRQVSENQGTLRERLLQKLVLGTISSTEAIEQGQRLGLDLVARCYLVVILKAELADRSEQFDYDEYRQLQEIITGRLANNPDIFLAKNDWAEFVLVLKGNTTEYLEEERDLLLEMAQQELKNTKYRFSVGTGAPRKRLAELCHSFVEALAATQNSTIANQSVGDLSLEKAELLKMDKVAVENYLNCGASKDFDEFFASYLQPLGETALKSSLIKNYILMDVLIATARLIKAWGGEIEQVVPEINALESSLGSITTVENLRDWVGKILGSALVFRDSQSQPQHAGLIRRAKKYIDQHYMDADISLNQLATLINLSPSHFSSVFAQETRQTFKDYLTEVRIQKAKVLLRTTALKSSEIAYQVGYNDPHYFSFVFKKISGYTPSEFRVQSDV